MGKIAPAIALLVLAGIMNASFTIPMKFTRKWAWENTWLVWGIWALLILPYVAARIAVPHLSEVYERAGWRTILEVAVCGLAWGIAQVLFGLAVEAIGIALAFTIVLGLSAACGSLIPFVEFHRDKVLTEAGFGILAGILLMLAGVGICGIAGRKREQIFMAPSQGRRAFPAGLICALLSGTMTAAMNLGLSFGSGLIEAAKVSGSQPIWRVNVVWLPLMAAGMIPNLVYCSYLMKRRRTAANYAVKGSGAYWGLTAMMAVLWFSSSLLYGAATIQLRDYGMVLGWPLFMSMIVISASIMGIVTGEWKGTGTVPVRIQLLGTGMLVVAIFVLSRAAVST